VPTTEGTPLDPVNPYGRSKAFVEKILGDFRAAYGLKSTILRYFNAGGADGEAQLGELREPETHLIPRAILAIQGYIQNFEVFGSNYDTPDGTAIRDYIHVSDLAQGHVLALKALLAGGEGGVFNLGTGEGHSVLAVLRAIESVTGENLGTPLGERRAGDPPILIADPTLSMRELQFRPVHSSLEEIIRSSWNWHQRAHPKRAK
jgi:UDP-glucose 4-epimerase/UDP-arabinose 4-epimerase